MGALTRQVERGMTVFVVSGSLVLGTASLASAAAPPVAKPDSYSLARGAKNVQLNILANDLSPSGGALSISYIDTFQPGVQLAVNGNNVLASVTSDASYGSREFEYTVSDGTRDSDFGVITVTVPDPSLPPPPPPPIDPPTARDDNFAPRGKGTFTYDVLANDYDPQGRPLQLFGVSAASSGGYNGYYKVSLVGNQIKVVSGAYLKDDLVVHYSIGNGSGFANATAIMPFAGVTQLQYQTLVKPRKHKAGKLAVTNHNLNTVQYVIREDYGGRGRELASGLIRPQQRVVIPIRLKRNVKGRPAIDIDNYLLISGERRQSMNDSFLQF